MMPSPVREPVGDDAKPHVTMPSPICEPIGDDAKPHVTSVKEWLGSTEPKGKKDGYGNQEYIRDEDLTGRVRKLRESLGLVDWAWGLWRFSNTTPWSPKTQVWLVPIDIMGGEPCVKTKFNELITKLRVFEKTLIEEDVIIEPEFDLLFVVPEITESEVTP